MRCWAGRMCRIALGCVFLVAGLLKLMDPVGTALIVESYFRFLGLGQIAGVIDGALSAGDLLSVAGVPAGPPAVGIVARVFGTGLALLESVCGVAVLAFGNRKSLKWLSGIMLLVFTGLTLAILILNPAMDCGCFGQAVHLTHAGSFIKNVVLCALWAGGFLWRKGETGGFLWRKGDGVGKKSPVGASTSVGIDGCSGSSGDSVGLSYGSISVGSAGEYRPSGKNICFGVGCFLIAAFCLCGMLWLPLVDFTEFRVGTALYGSGGADSVADGSGSSDGAYSVDGAGPAGDNRPAGAVLSFSDADGNYADELALTGAVAVMSIYDALHLRNIFSRIADFRAAAAQDGRLPIVLYSYDAGCPCDLDAIPFAFRCDRKTLMTLNRANGGVTLIDDGVISGKRKK